MKKLLASIIVLSGFIPARAIYATEPIHHHATFPTFAETFDGCDVPVYRVVSIEVDITAFSDREIWHLRVHVVDENAATGDVIEEDEVATWIFDGETGILEQHGVNWHVRDSHGTVVGVRAGTITMNFFFDILDFTPNSGPDVAADLCPALGANPL